VRPIVESRVKDPGRKAAIYDQLRTVLSETKGESAEKRCRYERLLEATLIHGSVPAAENAIKARSYEPYSECEPAGQLKQDASKGYNVAGALALVAGAISLVVSLFRKTRRPPLISNRHILTLLILT
jgi:hypothetical protein